MASGAIPNHSIAASSYFTPPNTRARLPIYARLHSDGIQFWSSDEEDLKPWIQADLGSSHVVTGLQTSGVWATHEWSCWVEKIKVKVGMSEDSLVFIKDSNGDSKVSDTYIPQNPYLLAF